MHACLYNLHAFHSTNRAPNFGVRADPNWNSRHIPFFLHVATCFRFCICLPLLQASGFLVVHTYSCCCWCTRTASIRSHALEHAMLRRSTHQRLVAVLGRRRHRQHRAPMVPGPAAMWRWRSSRRTAMRRCGSSRQEEAAARQRWE